jgi:hypothetical protein
MSNDASSISRLAGGANLDLLTSGGAAGSAYAKSLAADMQTPLASIAEQAKQLGLNLDAIGFTEL